MKVINTGNENNSGEGDCLVDAFNKVNENFYNIGIQLDRSFEWVEFKSLEDMKKAFDTINNNFSKLKE